MRGLIIFLLVGLVYSMMEPCGGPLGFKTITSADGSFQKVPTSHEDELRHLIECYRELYFDQKKVSHSLRIQLEQSWCEWIKQYLPF